MKSKKTHDRTEVPHIAEAQWRHKLMEVSKEQNIAEVTFHPWKRQFGQLDVNEARPMKELERENAELEKILVDSLLKNRVLEAVNEKNAIPGTQAPDVRLRGGRRAVLRSVGVPLCAAGTLKFPLSDGDRRRASAPGSSYGFTNCRASIRSMASAGSR